ncbi:MAG: hypothetical protein U0746_02845 [Gemmataceae bacterium]
MWQTILRVRRELRNAVLPALTAAAIMPLLVAVTPGLRSVAAEYLPPGPERLLVMMTAFGGIAEFVRLHIIRFRQARQIRILAAELERLQVTDKPREVA